MAETPPSKRSRHEMPEILTPEKSPNDKYDYRYLTLRNGLQVLLVSSDDPAKQKAAASVAVGVGSFSDPVGRCEGIAHYLEHMLCMGSSKYPGEAAMDEFLSQNGGFSNAFTECEHTCYYFEVNKQRLGTGLDMMAQFFIDPLMSKSASEREIKAIDSEFREAVRSDGNREEQLFGHLAKDGHPLRTFGWGNFESLRDATVKAGHDLNEELRSFYNSYYCIQRCRLSVFGVESLDSLEKMVRQSFECIPAKPDSLALHYVDAGLPLDSSAPFLLRVRPICEQHEICLTWQISSIVHMYRTKPMRYVQHLVGHEAEGSVLSFLKKEGLATKLLSGCGPAGFTNNTLCTLFCTTVSLTLAGLERWPEVISALFSYVHMLQQAGPQQWVWEELRDTSIMSWQYQEEGNPTEYVQELSVSMLPYFQVEPRDILREGNLFLEWSPSLTTEFLGYLEPQRCFLTISSSTYGRAQDVGGDDSSMDGEAEGEESEQEGSSSEPEAQEVIPGATPFQVGPPEAATELVGELDPMFKVADAEPPEVEPHFGTEFWKEPVPLDAILKAKTPQKGVLRFPDRNRFIATDFSLVDAPADAPAAAYPTITSGACVGKNLLVLPNPPRPVPQLRQVGPLAMWYARTEFMHPKVQLSLAFLSGASSPSSAVDRVSMSLMVMAINDVLTETAYMAEMAHLHCGIVSKEYGLDMHVGGYHHKVPVLLEAVIKQLLIFRSVAKWDNLLADTGFTKRIEAQRQELLRTYRNAYLEPENHCASVRRALLLPHELLASDKAKALASLSLENLRSFSVKALDTLAVDVLIQGNMTPREADAVAADVREKLCRGNPQPPKRRVVHLAEGMATYVVQSHDTMNKNCCVELYMQWLPRNLERLVTIQLLGDLIDEPFFDELRTKQQLGYSVGCSVRESVHIMGLSLCVTSANTAPAEVLTRIETFLSDFREKLVNMTTEKFEDQRFALAASKLEPIPSLAIAQGNCWGEIVDRHRMPNRDKHVFDRSVREAALLQAIDKTQVLAAFDEFMLRSARRRALTVVAIGGSHTNSVDDTMKDIQKAYLGSCRCVTSPAEFLASASFWGPDHEDVN